MKKKKSDSRVDLRPKVSLSKQKYIETIYKLQEKPRSNAHAHVKDIADELGIKMASVSGAAKSLEKKKLIKYSARRQISLTAEGMKMARTLNDKHRTLSVFFQQVLGCSPERAEHFACEIEHIIDDDIRARIAKLII